MQLRNLFRAEHTLYTLGLKSVSIIGLQRLPVAIAVSVSACLSSQKP
jgi:hypothetical protein